MHFNTYAESKISESRHHIGDKLCVVSQFVPKIVLRNHNKSHSCVESPCIHRVFKVKLSNELKDLRAIKDANFQRLNGQCWKILVHVSKTATYLAIALVNCLMGRYGKSSLSVQQRLV